MAEKNVSIQNFAFVPEEIAIHVGDTVRWTNNDRATHDARRDQPPTFNTGPIAPGDSKAIEFNEASGADGFEYFCGPHPFMKGRVIVSLRGSKHEAYSRDAALNEHDG